MLDKVFIGFHKDLMDTTQASTDAPVMEVELQSKMEWLCCKEVMVSDFERTFNGLVGDRQHILAELMDWESSSPMYTFNELRAHLW